jgi:hypothetical protein
MKYKKSSLWYFFIETLLLFLIYFEVTVLFFSPVIFDAINGKVIIGDGGDTYFSIWDFWNFRQLIIEKKIQLFSHYIAYPYGAPLFFSNVFNFIAFLLSILIKNFVQIYNILILFSFPVNAFSMYFLCRKLGSNRSLAFLLSISFAFSGYTISRSFSHLPLVYVFVFPLGYYLIKKLKGLKKILSFAFILFLGFLIHPYYLVFLMLMYVFLEFKLKKEFFISSVFISLLFFILTLPFLVLTIKSIGIGDFITELKSNIRDVNALPEDEKFSPIDYLVPCSLSYIGDIGILATLRTTRSRIMCPYIGPLLIVYVYVIFRQKKIEREDIACFLFLLLSLGAYIYDKIPNLLYLVLYHFFPGFNIIGYPQRFSVLVLFFIIRKLAVFNLFNKTQKTGIIISILVFLYIISNFPKIFIKGYTYPLISSYISSINISSDAVGNIPSGINCKTQYIQVFHQKPITGCCIGDVIRCGMSYGLFYEKCMNQRFCEEEKIYIVSKNWLNENWGKCYELMKTSNKTFMIGKDEDIEVWMCKS